MDVLHGVPWDMPTTKCELGEVMYACIFGVKVMYCERDNLKQWLGCY